MKLCYTAVTAEAEVVVNGGAAETISSKLISNITLTMQPCIVTFHLHYSVIDTTIICGNCVDFCSLSKCTVLDVF